MNTRILKFMFLTLVLLFIVAEVSKSQTLTAVDSFPTPSQTPFGLEWINGYLWHSDRASRLVYKIDPTTHAVIRSFHPGVYDPAGLAWNGSQLFCADWTHGKIFRIDTTDGAALDSFPSPDRSPFGLSWDGSSLMCAEVFTHKIYKLNPANGAVISSITIAGTYLLDLAWRAPNVWAVMDNDRIVQCDTATGLIVSNFPAPGPAAKGLAWDGQYFWACEIQNGKIYKIAFAPTAVVERTSEVPVSYSLSQNYPNPFNPSTTFQFELPNASYITLKIFNLLGQEVATLINEKRDAGQHSVQWNAHSLASGVYFYRLYAHPTDAKQTGDFVQTKKLLLLK